MNLVLLPGMMCDQRVWAEQCRALESDGHQILCGDLRGAQSILALAQGILSQCPARFALAGLSMGGIVAFEMWRLAPLRITHLALLDTNPHAELAERQAQRASEIAAVRQGGLRELVVSSLKPRYFGSLQRDNAVLRDLVTTMAMQLGATVFERQSMALRDRCDSTATLATINVPTLVLCGKEDELCPPHYHQLMAERIALADLVVLAESGHLPTMERPDATTLELRRWLARNAEARYG